MKKYIYLIIFAILTASCADVLTEKPYMLAVSTFYNTDDEAAAAVMAPISHFRGQGAYGHTDFEESLSEAQNLMLQHMYGFGTDYVTIPAMYADNLGNESWPYFYKAIKQCNAGIIGIAGGELSEDKKTKYISELRIIRAWCHLEIVRDFGKAIIRDESNYGKQNVPMSNREDVLAFILKDALYAAENAPVMRREEGCPDIWTAKAIAGYAYIELKEWAKAAEILGDVVDNSPYGLEQLSEYFDFEKVYGPDQPTAKDEIWYMKSSRINNAYGSAFGWYFDANTSIPLYEGRTMNRAKASVGGAQIWMAFGSNPEIKNWSTKDFRRSYCIMERTGVEPGQFKLGATAADGPCYFTCKWHDPEALDYWMCVDYPMIKYSDVLIAYSEALARSGDLEGGIEMVNRIHRRAYGKNPNVPDETVDFMTPSSIDRFMEVLSLEQLYETWGESKRWNWLVRTGLAKQTIKEICGVDLNEYLYQYKIPETEFLYNEALDMANDQNPGY